MLTAMQAADILGMSAGRDCGPTMTNGLKARCGALRKSGIAQAKQRMERPICPVRVKFPRTFDGMEA